MTNDDDNDDDDDDANDDDKWLQMKNYSKTIIMTMTMMIIMVGF